MAATNNFADFRTGLESPFRRWKAITPHDTNELSDVTRGIYVGGDGNVCLVNVAGDNEIFYGAKAGTVLPVEAKQVKATGTTATNLLGCW